jgi:hypothetical protein
MAIKPKLRPDDEEFSKIVAAANSGGGGDDKPASGGKGGGKSVNPMAKKGSADFKTMQKANAPDSFYGYYDQNTGDYVPWYIDMINGGGSNQAGPTFEGGFGTARLAGGLLNAAGVSPYGQDRPRAFMPMEAYRGGDTVPFSQAPAAAAPTGGGGSTTETPNPINVPQDFSNLSNAPTNRSSLVGYSPQVVAGTPDPYSIGQGGEMAGVSIPSGLLMNQPTRTPPSAMAMPQTNVLSVPQDPAYNAFVERVRNDPMFVGIIDNPEAMRNIYTMYKQKMGM